MMTFWGRFGGATLALVLVAGGLAACGTGEVAPEDTTEDGDKGPDVIIGPPETSNGDAEDVGGTVDVVPDPGELDIDPPDAAPPDVPDVEPPEDIPPPKEVVTDVPCVPDCEGRICGSDGCGGICGYCQYPLVCGGDGQCKDVCEKQCDGKFCGPDGCGGTCGACQEGLECGLDGLCYEPSCEPDCAGKVCGPDGCGADCGQCAEPQICINQGYACGLGPCGTVTAIGECQDNTVLVCEDKTTLIEQDCSLISGEPHSCQYDAFFNKYACRPVPECVPQCTGKICGDDGCGGSCGVCTKGWSCQTGACKPEQGADCGSITSVGKCEGDVLWECIASKLYKEDCAAPPFYEKCGWLDGKNRCK